MCTVHEIWSQAATAEFYAIVSHVPNKRLTPELEIVGQGATDTTTQGLNLKDQICYSKWRSEEVSGPDSNIKDDPLLLHAIYKGYDKYPVISLFAGPLRHGPWFRGMHGTTHATPLCLGPINKEL